MYYRYEANKNGQYIGIFQAFNPSQRRYFNRFLKAPKWYENNPDKDSRCWFTELGYQKYHHIIEELISELRNVETRLITAETLEDIAVAGKIQCIQLLPDKNSTS